MKRTRNILLGAVIAIVLFCSLGFYDQDYHVNQQVYYDDDCDIHFGTDYDFSIYSDTTGILEFDPLTAGYEIRFGTSDTDTVDLTWYGDVSGATVAFDEENCEVLFANIDLQLDDDAKLIFGTGDDVSMYSATADTLTFDPGAAGDTFEIGTSDTDAFDVKWYADTEGVVFELDEENCVANFGADANGLDAKFFADTSGDYVLWDASDEQVEFVGANAIFDDDSIIYIGTTIATDGVLNWDNTNSEVDLTTATGGFHVTASAVGDGKFGTVLEGSSATATKSEGLGAYVAGNVSGNADGKVYALGAWLNITAGTPTDGPDSLMAAADFGIYAAAAPELAATQLRVINVEYQVHADAAPVETTSMMHFNCDDGQDVPDYWFTTGNIAAVNYSVDTTYSSPNKAGAIKVYIGAQGIRYIWLFSDAGS